MATTPGRLGTRNRVARNATAAHAAARCDPETATRCVRPSTRKSSSVSVPISRRRSPITIPSARSPPGPGIECMRSRIPARHSNSIPSGPVRQAPTAVRHGVPLPTMEARAARRPQASSDGNGFSTAENRIVRPSSGTSSSAGQFTRTRAPSRGPPRILTLRSSPYVPGVGSASTVATHSRAPQSPAMRLWRCHRQNWRPDDAAPAASPAQSSKASASRVLVRAIRADKAIPAQARPHSTAAAPAPMLQASCSASTQPAHMHTANHPTRGIAGRTGATSTCT